MTSVDWIRDFWNRFISLQVSIESKMFYHQKTEKKILCPLLNTNALGPLCRVSVSLGPLDSESTSSDLLDWRILGRQLELNMDMSLVADRQHTTPALREGQVL